MIQVRRPCVSTRRYICVYQPEVALTALLGLAINVIQNGNGD